MKPQQIFNQYDEVIIISKNKHGIVLDYAYCYHEDMYNYLIDCENEILTCRENDLRKV